MSYLDFSPPSYRAASSDLTISISPLGLVELADEEFEVHGPRLNRYSLNWAMYLGHHWGYRRESGEMQLTVNYYRAFNDYLSRFTFGKGVHFRSPKATEAIVPDRLERIWEVDNDKMRVLLEMGQQGGITGDCFVKVAYEEPWTDGAGIFHPGRVRILPMNSSFCFPEFHPHDRTRLLRFKQKYRFWGTSLEGTRQVFTYTEILTDDVIEEYINDELIDSRPNPVGLIPVVHIPNVPVSGSPWGLADAHDIITINRSYNEIATDVADIVNYHASPVTVIVGAKASNLEKGAKKVWGGLPKDAQVFNLEGGAQGIDGALKYLELLKRSMHEIMNIPETALGQVQPISNTSGVALSIQYQPLMNRYSQKVAQYGKGIERINELALRPHNSGHWTIEGSTTSQFEQHLRAVLDLPLGDTSLRAPFAVMGNVLGGEKTDMYRPYLHLFARTPHLKIHQYRKTVRPGRKVGHVTAIGNNLDSLLEEVQHAVDYMNGAIDE